MKTLKEKGITLQNEGMTTINSLFHIASMSEMDSFLENMDFGDFHSFMPSLTKREYDSYEGSLNELLLTTISLVSWQNVVLIFLKSSLFEKMAAFSPVLIPAPSIHSMSMPKVWMNCLIRLLRKTKGCLKKKLIKPGKKWVLHYSNPQNNYKNE